MRRVVRSAVVAMIAAGTALADPGSGPEWGANAPGTGPERSTNVPGTGPEWSTDAAEPAGHQQPR